MLSDFGVYIVAIIKNWLGFVGAGLTMLGLVALANPRRGERVSYWARRFLLPLGLVLLFGAQFSAWRAERGRAETLGPETFRNRATTCCSVMLSLLMRVVNGGKQRAILRTPSLPVS